MGRAFQEQHYHVDIDEARHCRPLESCELPDIGIHELHDIVSKFCITPTFLFIYSACRADVTLNWTLAIFVALTEEGRCQLR